MSVSANVSTTDPHDIYLDADWHLNRTECLVVGGIVWLTAWTGAVAWMVQHAL